MLRRSERFSVFCLLVCITARPCFGHGSMVDRKVLCVGKELWRETLPLQSGSRIYKLERLKSNAWYEVKISYPASIPARFSLKLLRDGLEGSQRNLIRRLLNTEKLILKTESLEKAGDKSGLFVLVSLELEGFVAIPNLQERSLNHLQHSFAMVILVILCLVVALIVPRFLPSYLLMKKHDALSEIGNFGKRS